MIAGLSADAFGSGTRPSMAIDCPGFTPHVTTGVSSAALITTSSSYTASASDAIERHHAFAGDHACGHELASPLLGHDRTRPQAQGLYRIAMALSVRHALAQGLAVNYSAGAGVFKRNRGATPALEYQMVFDSHLPRRRRLGYALLAKALDAMTPTLERMAAG